MDTFYLVDYENVNVAGLKGCEKLGSTDHIIIFFTAHAKSLDLTSIKSFGKADMKVIQAPQGNQSADMYISSYLGYLVGKYGANKCIIVIISKDKDYDNVITYWKENENIIIEKSSNIDINIQKLIQKDKNSSAENISKNVSGNIKVSLNQDVMQAVRGAKYHKDVANRTAQIASELYGKDTFLSAMHNALKNEYSNGVELYKEIKPVLAKYADTTPIKVNVNSISKNDSSRLKSNDQNGKVSNKADSKAVTAKDKIAKNNEVLKILSKAGFSNNDASSVASIVVKNLGVKNSKQQVYKAILSKYGQGSGLNIYNHIKKHI